MPIAPRSNTNARSSSNEEDSDSSGSNSDVSSQDDSSDVFLIWTNLKKRIPTSAPLLLEWTHELWNGIALVTQMRRFLVLIYLVEWRHYTS